MRLSILFFLMVLIQACNSDTGSEVVKSDTTINENTAEENKETPPQKVETSLAGCYMKILKRDTMVLHLRQNGDSISGKINFDNYEKDSSSGEVRGSLDGDIVKLWYNFQSEGMNSVAELFFKKEDGSMIRGIGDIGSKGDTSYFTDHSAINYPADQSFSKVDCATVPGKYL